MNKSKACIATAYLLALTTWAIAQTVCYSGRLVELASGLPLEGFCIYTQYHTDSCAVRSDLNGYFEICAEQPVSQLMVVVTDKVVVLEAMTAFTIYRIAETEQPLSEVKVESFSTRQKNATASGSYGVVGQSLVTGTDGSSLLPALNTIPGVVMESRGYGGSHRISIRGSALRSPFAVRNVKMYLEGIPLASPDGTSPLELIDAADMEQVEVVKGPSGSLWGSGNGGVLLFTARRSPPVRAFLSLSYLRGSFGLNRQLASAGATTDNLNIRVSGIKQNLDGYRQQEFNQKEQWSAFIKWYAQPRLSYFTYLTTSKGLWGLPGGLTRPQALDNPTQAVPFSVSNNASLWRNRNVAALAQQWQMTRHIINTTSVYYNTADKRNPYGTSAFNNGYKFEQADGWGGRTLLRGEWRGPEKHHFTTQAGAEWQSEIFRGEEYTIAMGEAIAPKYKVNTQYGAALLFMSQNWQWKRLQAEAGLSANRTVHQIEGYSYNSKRELDTTAQWGWQWLPRVAAGVRLFHEIYFHASLSRGNSNPTIFEQFNSAYGLPVKNLIPERGLNRELSLKGLEKNTRISFELTAYHFTLSNALLPTQQITTIDTTTYQYESFVNAGSTNQQGFETLLQREWINRPGRWFQSLKSWAAFTAMHYRFGTYSTTDQQVEGKYITGVPLYIMSSGLQLQALDLLQFQALHYWYDRLPLNDLNTQWSAAYHLLNLQLSINKALSRNDSLRGSIWEVALSGGINNTTGARYTSFHTLNAVGGRYYNPSAPRNYYAMLSLTWKLF